MEASPDSDSRKLDPTLWLDRYGDYLYRYASRRLRDPEAAEEVVQETFLAGIRAQDQYAGRGDQRAWLLGILKRKIIDVYRGRQKRTEQSTDETGEDITSLLFDQRGHWKSDSRLLGCWQQNALEQGEFWEALHRCLAGLPQRQADVFSLRELEDQSSAEICKELNITASNLWVLLHRARLGLAKCLESY